MNAWGKSLDESKSSGIRFLADASGAFSRAWDVEFAAAPMLGTNRSKRYAVVIADGKVKSVHIEPDNTGAVGMFDRFLINFGVGSMLMLTRIYCGKGLGLTI
jgi:peroxiredoxin